MALVMTDGRPPAAVYLRPSDLSELSVKTAAPCYNGCRWVDKNVAFRDTLTPEAN